MRARGRAGRVRGRGGVGRRVLAVAVAGVLAGCVAVTSAAALPVRPRDVPDVAMVVAGGTGRTTAVRSGQPAFARLWQLLEPTFRGTERVPEEWTAGSFPQVRLTVVWGLSGVGGWPSTNRPPGGDVAVERQDQLVVAEDGTPWVRSDPAPAVEDDDIRWHRASRSLFDRLDRARLLGDLEGGPVASTTAADLEGPMRSVRWVVAAGALGLAAGAGGTLLMRRAAARREAGPPREEPRQVLIDLDE
ncbi:hypothetical protein GCM10010234_26440 [Streptomyces hawaiiensis]|uniref:hypothetical protein n=1 Tax=Streptomyces hawaiiensis TaxID=67305 RepID=UPI00336F2750